MSAAPQLRAIFRLQLFAIGSWVVVASGLPAVLTPFPRRWRKTAPFIQRWAKLGAYCLGLKVDLEGRLPTPGSLVVANHQGYVDIVALGSLFPCIFVARHDMRGWPLFGQLAASGATIFLNRENKRAGFRGVGLVREALAVGATVIAFPEGTSTDGTGLLPFRTGVFQAAIDAGAPVVPVGIRYLSLDGKPLDAEAHKLVGWFQGEPFLRHLLRLGGHRQVKVGIKFGAPLLSPREDRRQLAARAEEAVFGLLGIPPGTRPIINGRRRKEARASA